MEQITDLIFSLFQRFMHTHVLRTYTIVRAAYLLLVRGISSSFHVW